MAFRLLLVDDDPAILTLLAVVLGAEGYELARAESGQEALAKFDAHGADLVLLDVRMPGLDGFAVLEQLRAREAGAFVPVIFVTAQHEPEARLRGLDAGADEFLVKPIDRAILIAKVRSLLRLKETRDALLTRNAELERLRESQRELSTFIVHDLRNPIAVADANIEWVRAQLVEDGRHDLAEALAEARAAVSRQRALIGDLLVVAQMEEGELLIRRDEVLLARSLIAVERAHAREADERGLAIRTALDASVVVSGDAKLLHRLVENLVENAIRHTPRGGSIEIACQPGHDGGEIFVSNTGRPIAREDRTRIFGRFQRGDAVSNAAGRFGLGLHFCRRVAEAHGGVIDVVDRDAWPVSFRVWLPGQRAPQEPTP